MDRVDGWLVISVNANSMQMKAIAQLTRMSAAMNTSMTRLATGSRINRASDDPAGLVAVESMTAEQKSIQAQIEALDREEYRMGAREGAASVVSDQVGRLNELVVAAANTGGTSKEEREAMQIEADSILQSINYISNTTTFEGERVITGYDTRRMGQVTSSDPGPDGQRVTYSLADLARGGRLNLVDGNMDLAQQSVQAAVSGVATDRGAIGAYLKSNDSKRASLVTQLEEVTKTKSSIKDTDFAKETAEMVRTKALAQVATFVSSLAGEQNASTVLALISGAGKPLGITA